MHGFMQLDDPPTALFSSHYLVTLGAIRALHDLQLAERIALIGFDDIVLADLVRPAISVMAHDPTQLGTLAAERIFARLDGDTVSCSNRRCRREVDRSWVRRNSAV